MFKMLVKCAEPPSLLKLKEEIPKRKCNNALLVDPLEIYNGLSVPYPSNNQLLWLMVHV